MQGLKRTAIVISFSFLISLAAVASAQVPSGNVFFGYSYYSTDLSTVDRSNANGWEASVEGKIIPFIGIVADFDSHYGSQNFLTVCPLGSLGCTFNTGFVERNYLFGPRVSVSLGKIRPYAQVLIGAAHVSLNDGLGSDTSFATAVGGGVDYKLIRPLAWRIQADYVRSSLLSLTQSNVRISTGVVLRF